jgi:hypothetical protein
MLIHSVSGKLLQIKLEIQQTNPSAYRTRHIALLVLLAVARGSDTSRKDENRLATNETIPNEQELS